MKTIHEIVLEEGYEPAQIVPALRGYSAVNFVSDSNAISYAPNGVPESVWQRISERYNPFLQRPFRRLEVAPEPVYFKEKSDVYIGSKVTQRLVNNQFIMEQPETARRLYQYLNWTLRMSKSAQTGVTLQGRNGTKVLVFDVELHNFNGEGLYALCIPNDVVTHRTQMWQLADLLTAAELMHLLGIHQTDLPRGGVRAISSQFRAHRALKSDLRKIKAKIRHLDSRRKPMRYAHLKCIQTGNGGKKKNGKRPEDKTLTVSFSVFYDAVQKALGFDAVDLIPIVSITSKKEKNHSKKLEDFSVDYLLPVQVGSDWVGVVYRDYDCAMALLDGYDITNKAILCDPAFKVQALEWFHNGYNRLKVVPDMMVMEREDSLETQLSINSVDTVTVSSSTVHRSPSILSAYSTQSPGSRSCTSAVSVTPLSLSPASSVSNVEYHQMAVQMAVQPMTVYSDSERTAEWIKYCDEVIQQALTVKDYYGQFLNLKL